MPEGTKETPGRNEPCHCGSGRKYKQCCLEKDEAARRKAQASGEQPSPGGSASADAPKPGPSPREKTQQPWKGPKNTKGFQKLTTPRRSGGGG